MIKGLTDRGATFPRIGELRKGGEKTASGIGRDLDYFRFTSDDKDATEAFKSAYGEQPRSIRCYLPYSTPEQNFGAWMEEWQAGGLIRRCDGETINISRATAGNGYNKNPLPCIKASGKPCGCKQVGRLMVIIPELRRFAYVVALTTSINDIIEIHANLTAAVQIRGDLRGVPFILSRKPRDISTPDPKDPTKRVRREKWLLSIEPAPAWVQEQIAQLPAFDEPAMLPEPDDDEPPALKVIEPTKTESTSNGKASHPLDERKAALLAWYDNGGRINTSNRDATDKSVCEIAKAIGFEFKLEAANDNPSGRLAALVANIRTPQPAPVIEGDVTV
jgi:hypothetical protein